MSHIQALPEGTELVSDFRIERVLGAGGFGITYLAREIALDRAVTIKEYFPNDFAARGDQIDAVPRSEGYATDYQWGLDRFIDEAQTLAKFDHPNIVRVYRYFRANNTGYMVLHFEEGKSLNGWLQSLGRAPRQAELDQLLGPMLDALAVVHAADFLHRDIAPDNIIVRNDGSPVLIDFGAARGDIAKHSRTVSALVKPGYSPYEQYGEIGRQQGPWTDIYALAATLYHAITGKRPPDAPSRVVKDEIIPAHEAALSAYRPGFLMAIDQGLWIDIDKRPQNVAAWRAALLKADATPGQRGWFGSKRQSDLAPPVDAAGTLDVGDGLAATRALTEPLPGAQLAPPPPDVPLDGVVPRGRIVDFLEGVRPSPRAAPDEAPGAQAVGLTKIESGIEAAVKQLGAQDPAPVAKSKKRGGFFQRQPKPATEPEPPKSADIISNDRPVDVHSAPAAAVKRKNDRGQGAKRKPPKPRPVCKRSGWRWFPIVLKLAIGVVIATVLVRVQQSMPHFEFRSSSTVASSPGTTSRTVTGSTTKTKAKTKSATTERRGLRGEKKLLRTAEASASKVIVEKVRPAPVTLLLRTFEAHAGGTSAVRFADKGTKLVTVGGDGTLRVWDAKTFTLVRTMELEYGPATSLAVLGNRALTGHENGRIALWDLNLGMQISTFKRNDAPVSSLAFAGPKKFLAGALDWSAALWESATPSVPLQVFEGHKRDVLAIAYEPGRGLIGSGSADRTVKLWDGKSLSLLGTYPRSKNFVTAIAFSPDGSAILIGTLDGGISLYGTDNRRRKRRYRGHRGRVTSLQFIDGGREFVSASADGTVRLWNHRDGRALQTYGAAGAKISNAAVSPDGRFIAAGKDNGTVQIWNGAVLD
jgi:WD40 repeat protein/serine/threonine protein kinase